MKLVGYVLVANDLDPLSLRFSLSSPSILAPLPDPRLAQQREWERMSTYLSRKEVAVEATVWILVLLPKPLPKRRNSTTTNLGNEVYVIYNSILL